MKISILMPSYNDCESILYTLNSLVSQTYQNYELIIVDDGSTDKTKEVIETFIKKYDMYQKIKYFYQENKDQLNALKNASQYITGDYVYVLHSDDLLAENQTLEKMNKFVTEHQNYDAIISDLLLIDGDGNDIGIQKVKKYINKKYVIPLQLLHLGRNLYVDLPLIKKDVFLTKMFNNYLNWNGPFWLDCYEPSILNVKKVDFPFMKYRVFEGNYINNEIGLLNVSNGEIRVALNLMKEYNIICYKMQYYLYKLFNMIGLKYKPIYQRCETKNKSYVLNFIYEKRFRDNDFKKYDFYVSLLNFYDNYNDREIELKSSPKRIYFGSDMRAFHKAMLKRELEEFYYDIFKEMDKGFSKIVVPKKDVENIKNVLKFLCIYPYVEVIEK